MSDTQLLLKAESVGNVKTPNTEEKGQPAIASIGHFIDDLRKRELKMQNRFCTFEQMMEDESVATSIRFRMSLATLGMYWGSYKSTGSAASDAAAKFLNYNIRNMSYGTWFQAMKDANTDIMNGFSILNIVLEKRKYGKYKNSYCLKKLAPRSAKSVYAWVFDNDLRELKGFVQKPSLKKDRNSAWISYAGSVPQTLLSTFRDAQYPFLKTNEVLLFSYNSTINNPQGNPPLAECFNSYVEKKIIEQYELSGLSKDLGGIFVARSPSEIFEAANDPSHPNHAAALRVKEEFEDDLAKMHRSETTFVHLQSDTDDRGNPLYNFEIKGVQGGGTNYSTTEIIKEKKKAIYNTFGTQSLLLGQDNVGSNALSKDQNTTFRYYVERDMEEKADVLNTQLAPRLLAANGIALDYEDMPVFEALSPFKMSADEFGKLVQRLASVNKLEPTLYKSLLDDLGYDYDDSAITALDYSDKGTSRAGEGLGTSGTGDTQSVLSGDGNLENAGNS